MSCSAKELSHFALTFKRSVRFSVQEGNLSVKSLDQSSVELELQRLAGVPGRAPAPGWSRAGSVCRGGHLVAPQLGRLCPELTQRRAAESASNVPHKHRLHLQGPADAHCCAVLGSSSKSICARSVCGWSRALNVKSSYQWSMHKDTEFFLLHLHQLKRFKKKKRS